MKLPELQNTQFEYEIIKILTPFFLLVIFNDFGQTKEKTDIEKDESTFPREKTGIGLNDSQGNELSENTYKNK